MLTLTQTQHSYFVVMVDYGSGREAIVDPNDTRRNAVALVDERVGDGCTISFVHHIHDGICEDVTTEIFEEVRDRILSDAGELSANERDFIEMNFGCRAVLDHARELV